MRGKNRHLKNKIGITFGRFITAIYGASITGLSSLEGKPVGLLRGMHVTGIIKDDKELAEYKSRLGFFADFYSYLSSGDPMFTLDTVTYAAFGAASLLFNNLSGEAGPKNFGGFTQSFSFKNIDLNLSSAIRYLTQQGC